MLWPMKDLLASTGANLIMGGWMLLVLLIMAALVRNDNSDADGFALLNVLGYGMIVVGYRLLKYVGAWPVRKAT